MTDSAAHPSLAERITEWLRHERHALNGKELFAEVVKRLEDVEGRLTKAEADLEALKAKDGPAVEQVAQDAAATADQMAANVEKPAGAS